jgi:iron complex outermembrane receptor protein
MDTKSNFSLETGVRGDYVKQYGFELLPRISALFKITPKFTVRAGGGLDIKRQQFLMKTQRRCIFKIYCL